MKEIVIIDDEVDILEILNYNLSKEEFKTKIFNSSIEGLKYVNEVGCDLVITDWLMPELDGIELCKKLHDNSSTKHIPVIVISCKSEENDVATALKTGAEDYFIKPFKVKELVSRINNMI